MKKALFGILIVAFTISSAIASKSKETKKVIFLTSDNQIASRWKPVMKQLANLGVQETITRHALKESTLLPKQPNTIYIGQSNLGLVMTDGRYKHAINAIKNLVSDDLSTRDRISSVLAEARALSNMTELDKIVVDKNGFVKVKPDVWATLYRTGEFTRSNWVLLTSNEDALNSDWRLFIYRTTGTVTIEMIDGSSHKPNKLARIIAARVNRF